MVRVVAGMTMSLDGFVNDAQGSVGPTLCRCSCATGSGCSRILGQGECTRTVGVDALPHGRTGLRFAVKG